MKRLDETQHLRVDVLKPMVQAPQTGQFTGSLSAEHMCGRDLVAQPPKSRRQQIVSPLKRAQPLDPPSERLHLGRKAVEGGHASSPVKSDRSGLGGATLKRGLPPCANIHSNAVPRVAKCCTSF